MPRPGQPLEQLGRQDSWEGVRAVVAEVRRQGENVKLTFPFAAPTPSAVFRRADTL